MTVEKRESSRNLLDQIEGDWDSPRPPAAAPAGLDAAALDAAADRLIDTLDPPLVSVPTMADLDGGWEDLEGEGETDEDDEDDANEPELPDERLDPVAYAEAKQARDARIEARSERRRIKAEAKKARRKARVDTQKQKQKQKTRKAGGARPGALAAGAAKAELKTKARAKADARRADRPVAPQSEQGSAARETGDSDQSRARKPGPSRLAKRPMLSRTNTWMLGFAIVIFVAAAIFAAVVAR